MIDGSEIILNKVNAYDEEFSLNFTNFEVVVKIAKNVSNDPNSFGLSIGSLKKNAYTTYSSGYYSSFLNKTGLIFGGYYNPDQLNKFISSGILFKSY